MRIYSSQMPKAGPKKIIEWKKQRQEKNNNNTCNHTIINNNQPLEKNLNN